MKRRAVAVVLGAAALLACGQAAWSEPPPRWGCAAEAYEDGVCDCGCGAVDRDCAGSTFATCARSACGPGEVPWEHAPESCMSSACGDGWRDEAAGEACDDFEALDGGGCSRDCAAVNPGWACGDGAEGCAALPGDDEPDDEVEETPPTDEVQEDEVEANQPPADEGGAAHEGHGAEGGDEHGCASTGRPAGAAWPLLALGAWLVGARRRRGAR
jgi:uncharacterized protein (TIGR03382 family)